MRKSDTPQLYCEISPLKFFTFETTRNGNQRGTATRPAHHHSIHKLGASRILYDIRDTLCNYLSEHGCGIFLPKLRRLPAFQLLQTAYLSFCANFKSFLNCVLNRTSYFILPAPFSALPCCDSPDIRRCMRFGDLLQ